jgi:hypothetical protein
MHRPIFLDVSQLMRYSPLAKSGTTQDTNRALFQNVVMPCTSPPALQDTTLNQLQTDRLPYNNEIHTKASIKHNSGPVLQFQYLHYLSTTLSQDINQT